MLLRLSTTSSITSAESAPVVLDDEAKLVVDSIYNDSALALSVDVVFVLFIMLTAISFKTK